MITGKILAQLVRYEMESAPAGLPGNHIQSNIGYPGPLGNNEKRWAYADCYTQITDSTVLERERLNILNPSAAEGDIKITFINTGTGERTYYYCKIGSERLISLDLLSLPAEIFRERIVYSVVMESTVPVVAMQLRRFYFKRNQSPRGMIGMMAYPIGDHDIHR